MRFRIELTETTARTVDVHEDELRALDINVESLRTDIVNGQTVDDVFNDAGRSLLDFVLQRDATEFRVEDRNWEAWVTDHD